MMVDPSPLERKSMYIVCCITTINAGICAQCIAQMDDVDVMCVCRRPPSGIEAILRY